MDPHALGQCGSVIYRRADKRVAESDQRAEPQQPLGLGGSRGADPEAEELASAPEQSRITGRVRRGSQQEDLCFGGHAPDLAKVSRLQASAHREQFRQRNLARQLFPAQFAAQFDQPQRVSARLGDDPLAYSAVNAARYRRREQLPGLLGWKAPDLHRGDPLKAHSAFRQAPHGEQHRYRISAEPPGNETQNAG